MIRENLKIRPARNAVQDTFWQSMPTGEPAEDAGILNLKNKLLDFIQFLFFDDNFA